MAKISVSQWRTPWGYDEEYPTYNQEQLAAQILDMIEEMQDAGFYLTSQAESDDETTSWLSYIVGVFGDLTTWVGLAATAKAESGTLPEIIIPTLATFGSPWQAAIALGLRIGSYALEKWIEKRFMNPNIDIELGEISELLEVLKAAFFQDNEGTLVPWLSFISEGTTEVILNDDTGSKLIIRPIYNSLSTG